MVECDGGRADSRASAVRGAKDARGAGEAKGSSRVTALSQRKKQTRCVADTYYYLAPRTDPAPS